MENEQVSNAPQMSSSDNGTLRIVQVNVPDMIKQGSILPTFVAPPPPPPSNETK